MPVYFYKCENCEKEFKRIHSMKIILTDCEECKAKNTLIRLPSLTINLVTKEIFKVEKNSKDIISKGIEENKEELRALKQELLNKRE